MNSSEIFWNRLANKYDKIAKDKSFSLIVDKSKKHLKPNDIVLDFACATGLYSFEFVDGVKKVQAFDISAKMIALAKNIARENQVDNISFSQTTIFDEKFGEATFDTILSLNILLYFNDVENILNRMYALLKPNGLIITSTACLKEKRTFMGGLSSSFIFILSMLKILPYLKFYKMCELEKTITNCGFKIIETNILIDNPATEYFIVAQKVNE